MSLQPIKNSVFLSLQELFAGAEVDYATGDQEELRKKLKVIAKVADAVGVPTELTTHTLELRSLYI